jgi:glycosidase
VGYAFDHPYDREESPQPSVLEQAVNGALAARNLPAEVLPFAQVQPIFTAVRDTAHRHAKVAELGRSTPLILLVEMRAEFVTASEGLYSWRVFAKLSAGRRGSKEPPVVSEFELPAALQFDHEKDAEAVSQVANTLADRVGTLMDTVLALPPPPPVAASGAETQPAPTVQAERSRGPSTALASGADAIYFVLLDRYANGNPANDGEINLKDPAAFHGGDLAGVMQHLDELQALGIRTVWLSPLFKTRQVPFFGHGAFHGYWVEDLKEIEPRFGTMDELRALSDALHARGMRLLLDMVLNHVAFDAPLLKEHPDWFHHLGDIKDWNDPKQVLNGDVMGLPDLAQEKPEVDRYLTDTSLKWADESNADGFRLDAVRHVPLGFWARFNERMREHRAGEGRRFFLLGEMLDGSPTVLAKAEREGKFDALFDFPLLYAMTDVFCNGKPPARLGAILSLDRIYPNAQELVTLLDNHDLPRVLTACHGDVDRVRRALTFQLTARGIPSITYGTEVGLTGEKEPVNRADMRFPQSAPMRDTIASLLKLRQEHPSLQRGSNQILAVQDGILGYARVVGSEAALIFVSSRPRPFSVGLPAELAGATLTDASTGANVTLPLAIAPNSVQVLFASPATSEGFSAWAERARKQTRPVEHWRAVEFKAKGAPGPHDAVYVVGSGPELGGWEPSKAVGPLSARNALVELPAGGVYEYKLLVRQHGKVTWEPGENRVLWVKEGAGSQRAELTWGR